DMDIERLLILPDRSVRQVIACIDRNGQGIALVVDHDTRLLATVTDGDLRRAILADLDLDAPLRVLLERRPPPRHPTPLTAPVGTPQAQLLRMMTEHQLRHIPLVDEAGRVVDVVLLSQFASEVDLPVQAVVMAGGSGDRLRPLTNELPKAMLPIGERPLLEHILRQLRQTGIREVFLSTHYKAEVIANHFGDGRNFGVTLRYLKEDHPLGTAGALGLLEASDTPLLVINGDILTRVDFRAMWEFHQEHQADMTVAVRQEEVRLPYGVVETNGMRVTGITEKPVVRHFINAGIYLLDPKVCRMIPRGQPSHMTDLIGRLVAQGYQVISFPIREYWQDIGRPEQYHKAMTDVEQHAV
ncbi:MAG: nucleotidyltransferase family protein, partial [Candidatus Omnitrophica bacterium]|nr:nucleotidyltransferase family protein [Candidatus Omnitrophota bacterium]